ncbi:MAG: hypothetical protein COB23_06780 [Methylophaga sp.]|nr:MAG: hypothetical protein COB23_06780 [Methylophaga sp.]
MTNNDVLRRLRYTFDYNDKTMIGIFAAADSIVTREQISNWLKKEEDPDYKNCNDVQMATFLNGLINTNRGKKEGEQPKPEKKINNNIIFRKLKIALNLRDDNILEMLLLADLRISKHELSAFFRRADHKHFRPCKDQILRNFIRGIQLKYRPDDAQSDTDNGFQWKE